MVQNLRKVVSNWPGVIKVNNKDNSNDKEYVLVGKEDVLGAMWLGRKENPVEVHYVGKLPDGRFASYCIMSIWDEGNYHICWKFAADAETYTQQVDGTSAPLSFVLVLADNDNIKLTTYAPENETFHSTGTKEVNNYGVSKKIAGAP